MRSVRSLVPLVPFRATLTAALLLGAAVLATVTLVTTVPDRVLSASLLAFGLLLTGIALDRSVSAARGSLDPSGSSRPPPDGGPTPPSKSRGRLRGPRSS